MPRQPQQPRQPIRHVVPVRGEQIQIDLRPSPRERGQDDTTLTGEEMRRRERGR